MRVRIALGQAREGGGRGNAVSGARTPGGPRKNPGVLATSGIPTKDRADRRERFNLKAIKREGVVWGVGNPEREPKTGHLEGCQ